jgi:hypothetical protein
MHRFMRRCSQGQGQAGDATGQASGQADSGASQSQGQGTGEQDEYLKDVGENIKAFLESVGKYR